MELAVGGGEAGRWDGHGGMCFVLPSVCWSPLSPLLGTIQVSPSPSSFSAFSEAYEDHGEQIQWKTQRVDILDRPGLPESPGWGKPLLILARPENSSSGGFKPLGLGFQDINRCQPQSGELRLEMSQEEKKKSYQ